VSTAAITHAMTPPLPAGGLPNLPWPALREDLQLHHGAALPDGQPSWTLHDPVRHRFHRIDWLTYEVLCRWWLGDAALIARQIGDQTTLMVDESHVLQVLQMARQHQWVQPQQAAAPRAAATGDLRSALTWLLHHYLFFRIPLINPDRLLQRLLPRLAWLGSPAFTRLSGAALALGLVGLARQWDQAAHQWLDLLSWRGALLYGLTLVGVKLAHEFGHALVAKRHGLRVPTMGVAFMVLWPVAYTDTSEAWRLADPRARMHIAAAGVRTELTLAAWATLAWVLLPDGALRTAAFIVATMTWVSTLLVNLSPFMRFDGYFLLSDALDLPNLHERSFALARWQLRRLLLGWQAEAPEACSTARRRALIAFAWATWGYRLVLYLGIAWLVYTFAFKALGIVLMAVELGWFIAAPVWRELRDWGRGRSTWLRQPRAAFSALALLALAGLAALPWPVRESAGALLTPARELVLQLPGSATLQQLPPGLGQPLRRGDLLLAADAPALTARQAVLTARVQQLEQQVATASLGGEQQAQWSSLQAALATARDESRSVAEELGRYQPRAPFDAVVVDVDPSLRAGVPMGARQPLVKIASPGAWRVVAYVSESAARQLHTGDTAAFTADAEPLRRQAARIASIAPHASAVMPEAVLAQAQGGLIDAREQNGHWLPVQPLYRVELSLEADPGLALRHWRGHVVLQLPARSLWERLWQAGSEVWVREAGF
jgi:putative peptide zinc metalloprotease protein